MARMMRELKPEQPADPINLDEEIPTRERAEDEVTVLADPERQRNVNQPENVEQSEWAKNMTKTMAQMQSMMKEKGLATSMDYSDLSLDGEGDPLHLKLKFPNMKKYSGTDDPHLHLKQYTTYMKSTGLTKAQIVQQFPMSLEGTPIHWYYTLEAHVQSNWEELCAAFIKQYGLNIQLEVSLRELQNTK